MDPSLGLVIYALLGFGTILILFVAYNAFRTALGNAKSQEAELQKQVKERLIIPIQERELLLELVRVHLEVQKIYSKQQLGQLSIPILPNKTLHDLLDHDNLQEYDNTGIRDRNELEMHHLRPTWRELMPDLLGSS